MQGYVTGEGPYANWAKHVSDPCAPTPFPSPLSPVAPLFPFMHFCIGCLLSGACGYMHAINAQEA